MQTTIRVITEKQKEEVLRRCKKFFDAMADTLVASGEPMKIMRSFPGLANSSIAYSKIESKPGAEEKFPPIRIKISAQSTHLSSYLDFYPEEGAGAKRLLLEILLQIFPDDPGISIDFYDPEAISPETAVALMLFRVRVLRAIYEKHRKTFERIFQKELDFTQELYFDEAEKIIQNL